MVEEQRGLSIPEGDPIREFSPEEKRALTLNLRRLLEDIYTGHYSQHRLDTALLRDFHARLFDGVRDHAGRCRSRSFGQERLTFGPHSSAKRADVPGKLDSLFLRVQRMIAELREYRQHKGVDAKYVEQSIRVAVLAHAEVIRIHPFEDGNGRSSRALLDHVLLSLGLKPIPTEVPKQEYIECLNAYFVGDQTIELLVDLYVGLYPLGNT